MSKQKQTNVSHGALVDTSTKLIGTTKSKSFNLKTDGESKKVFKINAKFDFSQVSIDWLIDKAIRSIVIDTQKNLRLLSEDELTNRESETMNVLLDPTPARVKLSEADKIKRLAGKMTDEEKQNLIDELLGNK